MPSCTFRKEITRRDSKLAWIALVASICIHCTHIGLLWSFSLLYSAMLEEYKASKEKTAWIGSIPFGLTCFLCPFCLYASSKFSIRICIITGSMLTGISLLATSFTKDINLVFLTFSLIYGIGSSLLLINAYRAINCYFEKRHSTATGLLTGGTTLMQIPITQLLVKLLENYSLQKTLQIYAAASTVICFLGSLAYVPTNFETTEKSEARKTKPKSTTDNYKALLKNKVFCLWLAASTIMLLSYSVSSVHLVQFAIDSGVPEKTAKQFPFYSAIGTSVGRISSGLIFDLNFFDKVYLHQILIISTGLISLIGSFSTNQTHLISFVWIYSTFDGLFKAAGIPVMRSLVGLDKLSEAISIMNLFVSTTVMLGPPIVGFIVDKTNSYKPFFYVAGTPLIIGALLLFVLRCMKDFKPSRNEDDTNKHLKDIDTASVTREEKEQLFFLQLETNV